MKPLMKAGKIALKFSLLFVLMLCVQVVFAQDSATVAQAKGVVGLLEGKFGIGTYVAGAYVVVSEIMGFIPTNKLAANSPLHQVWLWAQAIFGPSK